VFCLILSSSSASVFNLASSKRYSSSNFYSFYSYNLLCTSSMLMLSFSAILASFARYFFSFYRLRSFSNLSSSAYSYVRRSSAFLSVLSYTRYSYSNNSVALVFFKLLEMDKGVSPLIFRSNNKSELKLRTRYSIISILVDQRTAKCKILSPVSLSCTLKFAFAAKRILTTSRLLNSLQSVSMSGVY
jgi:hypothetical protein